MSDSFPLDFDTYLYGFVASTNHHNHRHDSPKSTSTAPISQKDDDSSEMSMTDPKSRHVHFDNQSKVILIPSRSEYREADISLWFDQDALYTFQEELFIEIDQMKLCYPRLSYRMILNYLFYFHPDLFPSPDISVALSPSGSKREQPRIIPRNRNITILVIDSDRQSAQAISNKIKDIMQANHQYQVTTKYLHDLKMAMKLLKQCVDMKVKKKIKIKSDFDIIIIDAKTASEEECIPFSSRATKDSKKSETASVERSLNEVDESDASPPESSFAFSSLVSYVDCVSKLYDNDVMVGILLKPSDSVEQFRRIVRRDNLVDFFWKKPVSELSFYVLPFLLENHYIYCSDDVPSPTPPPYFGRSPSIKYGEKKFLLGDSRNTAQNQEQEAVLLSPESLPPQPSFTNDHVGFHSDSGQNGSFPLNKSSQPETTDYQSLIELRRARRIDSICSEDDTIFQNTVLNSASENSEKLHMSFSHRKAVERTESFTNGVPQVASHQPVDHTFKDADSNPSSPKVSTSLYDYFTGWFRKGTRSPEHPEQKSSPVEENGDDGRFRPLRKSLSNDFVCSRPRSHSEGSAPDPDSQLVKKSPIVNKARVFL
jgi:hypothetical protein